jgi:alkylation response protein AidB-like acyl-CoA dehydrogenase
VAAGVGTPVDGGYRLSGKWPMVTGALDAPWALLFGTIHEDGAVRTVNGFPDARAFIVPAADFHVEHTWEQASAMRGTGSHRVTASEAFVPEEFARSLMAPGPKLIDRPALRLPRGSESPVTNAAIVLGVTRRALDEATALAAAKVGSYDNVAYSDHPGMQRSIGSMHAGVQVLSAGMAAMAEEVWAAAVESEHIPARVRARMWSTMFWTLDQCRAIVSELLTVSTSSVYTGRNPIEFALRDVHAICATMEMARNLQEEAGRVILGLEPRVPMF